MATSFEDPSLFDASPPSLRMVISTLRATVSTATTTPRTSAPRGNAPRGSSTNASPRLHILIRASASRAIATNTPPLVTFLTYPSTREPGCNDRKMSVSEVSEVLESVLPETPNERSISPPSSLTPTTVVVTTRPGLKLAQGFSARARPTSRPRSHACARPRRVPVSCAKTLPPSFAVPTFTTIAGIVTPFFT